MLSLFINPQYPIGMTLPVCVCGSECCSVPYGYCHCGCGKETNISDQTHPEKGVYAGLPYRFLKGHDKRSKWDSSICVCGNKSCAIPYGTCHCGCKEKTKIAVMSQASKGWRLGEPKPFISGHAIRLIKPAKKGPNEIRHETIEGIPCVWMLLTRDQWTVLWEEHYRIVKDFRWWCSANLYACTTLTNGKSIQMARMILDDLGEKEPDHENGNRLDNRGSNIRPATGLQNHWNLKTDKRNTSGWNGVSPGRRDKWRARINVNGKSISLGEFSEKEQAIEARKAAELKHYGKFRRNK